MQCGDSAGPRLQEPDEGCGRQVPAHQGGVGQSWSASDWQCNQGMAQETVIGDPALQLTEDISNMHCEHDCFACFNASRILDYCLNTMLSMLWSIWYWIVVCKEYIYFLTLQESAFPFVQTDNFYKNCRQFGKDVILKIKGVVFTDTL